ncbi:helix-turn-helix domain-containing protein [Demequina sp.]|uniref:helix-turn-helix domain-containing protein n=1 Tax=Demequina sp. TaxID=2050685 RepID=UPI003D132650
MLLIVADPPYLGRANRWYGDGRGHSDGRGRADDHPEAREWDRPEAHIALVDRLEAEADGWAIAATPASLPLYLEHAPAGVRVAVWLKENAIPSGSRIRPVWEPVLIRVPQGRTAHGTGVAVDDALSAGLTAGGFAGRKPAAWTHWVLAMLGFNPDVDELVDAFPGSGAVATAAANYSNPGTTSTRRREVPATQAQQLRRTARGSRSRRAAVLAALRAGGSVRAVAAEAGVSTNTVQRWKHEAGLTGANAAAVDS